QAEDGIRDGHVTGVQTCALPISLPSRDRAPAKTDSPSEAQRGFHEAERLDTECDVFIERDAELVGALADLVPVDAAGECLVLERSEERRVGKEGRSRWLPVH